MFERWLDMSLAMKLSGPRAFQPVVMTVVAIVVAPFFAAIIIATWSCGRGGRSSTELLGTWSTWSRSTWSELGVARLTARCGSLTARAARRGLLSGSLSGSLVGSIWLAGRLGDGLDGFAFGCSTSTVCGLDVPICSVRHLLRAPAAGMRASC